MHSRVAAVMAPRTHNRRRVTGSSGRRREGRESESQRPNISRHHFYSSVLLLLFVMMMFYGSSGVAQADEAASRPGSLQGKYFDWRDKNEEEMVSSLRVPCLVDVNGGVFAVAEAQCTKKDEGGFTGIASELLELSDGTLKTELGDSKLKTQVLDECSSEEGQCPTLTGVLAGSLSLKDVHVGRPTTVVKGSDIYMLAGNYSRTTATNGGKGGADALGLLLVRGNVSADGKTKRIHWNDTYRLPWTSKGNQHESLTGLIGGGGSGVKMRDGTFLFPVEGTKKENNKTVSLILYFSATDGWTLSKEMSDDGCSDPSVVEREKDKLMMMTACDDGRRRVYESGDKGESWTEALGTLSRVWGKKKDGEAKNVGSGFITATLDGDGTEKRNVMLVTLPVYSKKQEEGNGKDELHLWLTDNTHIVDIGPVSGVDDAAASALLYKSAGSGDQGNNNEKLIALYEKKNADGKSPSPGMVSVLLKKELKRVKEVLATWKEVDERVSQLCPTSSAEQDKSTANACSAVKITDGLVGFLSGNLSDTTWRDEYLGVNATVKGGVGTVATGTADGVKFTGRGAGAEWPVGSQGENQLYHFANYNFTLVATVSIHNVPKEGSIPLMGVKMNDGDKNTVLLGLSYAGGKKRAVLCNGKTTEKQQSSDWDPEATHQVAIVLQNSSQGSVYVDGERVCMGEQREMREAEPKEISHFYIGGDGQSAEDTGRNDVSVTVRNVLLYNRLWTSEEIAGLAKKKITIPMQEGTKITEERPPSPAVSGSGVQGAVSQPQSGRQRPSEHEQLNGVVGAEGGGASSAASTAATPSSDVAQTVAAGSGGTTQGEGIQPQDGEVNAMALNSSLGNMSWGNNTGDASTVGGSGLLPLLLLLG
ncbi:trans-sialidase, putative, partial [Trypanosoma cruzi marinkellei]